MYDSLPCGNTPGLWLQDAAAIALKPRSMQATMRCVSQQLQAQHIQRHKLVTQLLLAS
jgi:hypothetical protein